MLVGKEIEISVDRNSSRNWKSPLQWIWNEDSDNFTYSKEFPVTRYVNLMSNTLFKVFKINESIKTCMKKKK
jgi:hypothetical protein